MTDSDHHKILHAVCTTISFLTKGGDMGIISYCHCQPQTVTQHGCQRDDALPGQIGRILNATGYAAGTWCTDTDGAHALISTILFQQGKDILTQGCHVIVHIRIICSSKIILCHDLTSYIHHSQCSSLNTDVNTNHTGLDLVNRLNSFNIFHISRII